MTLTGLSVAYLRDRALNTALNILILALAVATLVILALFSAQLGGRFQRDAQGIDLVVGAKGSPLQLILSAIYQVDAPTGNVPLDTLELLRRDPTVEKAIPLALGDNFRGFRIVGTEPSYPRHYRAELGEGAMFAKPYEAVIGADVVRRTGARVGQRFVGSHGLAGGEKAHQHEETPFIVVGVLKPTGAVVDRLILTSVDSVWDVHGIDHEREQQDEGAHQDHGAAHAEHGEHGHDHDEVAHDHAALDPGAREAALDPEITAVLVSYRSPLAAVRLPNFINRQTNLQAAAPAVEIARLMSLVGVGLDAIRAFAVLLMATGGLSIFAALYAALRQRQGGHGDLAGSGRHAWRDLWSDGA
jgi:putative ABC transport system permease protein